MYAYSVGGYFTFTCMEGEVLHVSAVEGVAFTCLYLDMCGNALFYWFYMLLPNNRWLFCLYEVVQTLRWLFYMHVTVKVFSEGHLKNGRQEECFCLVFRVVLQEE